MIREILHIGFRLIFGVCLFVSQFTSNRNTLFTDKIYLVTGGVLIFLSGILLWIIASHYLRKAAKENRIAVNGPYKYLRHPIYASIYILSIGLGLIFFAWLWFVVMIAFIPLWYMECRNEEKEMIKLCGQEYIDYQKKTGMFFPIIFR